MNQAILALSCVAFSFGFYFLGNVLKEKKITFRKKEYDAYNLFYRLLSTLLFGVYMPHLFTAEQISYQIGLTGGLFDPTGTVLIIILKWFTFLVTAVTMTQPFYKKKEANYFTCFVTPVIILLNCIFFKQLTISIVGSVDYYHWKIIIYAIITALIGAISGSQLIRFIVEKKGFKDNFGKTLGRTGLFTLLYLPAFFPEYMFQVFFGLAGEECCDFTPVHRLLIYTVVAFFMFAFFLMKNRSREEKRYFLMMLALSGFLQYFYYQSHRSGLASLPLHLCNTAIALMFFAYLFNLKGVFYFTYFVNVMGALSAVLLPNSVGSIFDMENMYFWYNHTYATVLPLLGVALKVFDRPNIKLMGKAIVAFTVYVLAAALLDGWLNNSPSLNPGHTEVDYFFLYSDFFVNKFAWAVPIKYTPAFILDFQVGDTMVRIYYLYVLTIYAIAIALMFAMWGGYGIVYKVEDAHKELLRRKVLMHADKTNLQKELNGRSPKEPLHPEGANMIKINHFSKTYAGSDRKSVDDLNLEIYEGEVFGFIGHNGAGKSTTIKSMVGIQTITEGSIEIQGYDIARQPLEAKLNIGYVSDNHAVYEKLTGREYISYVAELYMVNEKDKNDRIDKYATMFGLTEALDREIKSYSHGMKQKLMVISALIHNPKVWILDEPLTGLDPTSAWQIKECMRLHAAAGNIVFFSSHVIEVVEKICDRVAIISGGKLCRVCQPEELTREGVALEELYLRYAKDGVNAVFGDKKEGSVQKAQEVASIVEKADDSANGEQNE